MSLNGGAAVHHYLHDIALWLVFVLGQVLHVYVKAWLAVENKSIADIPAYIRKYRPILLARAFAVTLLFVGGMVTIDAIFPGLNPESYPGLKICLAGFVGLTSDNVLERFQDRIPGLSKIAIKANNSE